MFPACCCWRLSLEPLYLTKSPIFISADDRIGRAGIFIVVIVSQPRNPVPLYRSMADDIFLLIVSLWSNVSN
jgi:hypothetical protein